MSAPEQYAENAYSPPAALGMPGEEEIAALIQEHIPTLHGDREAARAILSLIRPAFEAKDAEIQRIKDEVELTMMSLIFVPAIRSAIEALSEDDDLQPFRARAEAALSAEAKLAQAVVYDLGQDIMVESRGNGTWAVKSFGTVLNTDGLWEGEPLPSGRDADFISRTRFPLEEAFQRARTEASAIRGEKT